MDWTITLLFDLDPARLLKIYWGWFRPLLFHFDQPRFLKTKVGQSLFFQKSDHPTLVFNNPGWSKWNSKGQISPQYIFSNLAGSKYTSKVIHMLCLARHNEAVASSNHSGGRFKACKPCPRLTGMTSKCAGQSPKFAVRHSAVLEVMAESKMPWHRRVSACGWQNTRWEQSSSRQHLHFTKILYKNPPGWRRMSPRASHDNSWKKRRRKKILVHIIHKEVGGGTGAVPACQHHLTSLSATAKDLYLSGVPGQQFQSSSSWFFAEVGHHRWHQQSA